MRTYPRRKPVGRLLAAFAITLALTTPLHSAQAAPKVIEACQRLLKIFFNEPVFVEKRAKEFLPGIREKYQARWTRALETTPESLNGISLQSSLDLLAPLKEVKDPAAQGSHVRNATFFVRLGQGQRAVVKKMLQRTEMSDNRVYTFTNNPKYEVLAFIIDRHLGTNLVPPTIMLDATTVAQLMINAGPVSSVKMARDPGNLLEMTHTHLLDVLTGNGDRGGPDNLLRADAEEVKKIVAIDFDLSRPMTMFPVEAAMYSLAGRDVLLEPGRKLGKNGYLPGVFSKRVVDNLRTLEEAKIKELAKAAGLTLTAAEVTSVLAGRWASLATIEAWKKTYGAELIELP